MALAVYEIEDNVQTLKFLMENQQASGAVSSSNLASPVQAQHKILNPVPPNAITINKVVSDVVNSNFQTIDTATGVRASQNKIVPKIKNGASMTLLPNEDSPKNVKRNIQQEIVEPDNSTIPSVHESDLNRINQALPSAIQIHDKSSLAEKLEQSNALIEQSIKLIEAKIREVDAKLTLASTPTKPVTHRTELEQLNGNPLIAEVNAKLGKVYKKISKQKHKIERLRKRENELQTQGGRDLTELANEVKAVEGENAELKARKKALESLNNDVGTQKQIESNAELVKKYQQQSRELQEEIKQWKQKFRIIDKSLREDLRSKSQEHRQGVLKAHYQMQHLKSTIAQIKANKYTLSTSPQGVLAPNSIRNYQGKGLSLPESSLPERKNSNKISEGNEIQRSRFRLPELSTNRPSLSTPNTSNHPQSTTFAILGPQGSIDKSSLIKRHMNIMQKKRDQDNDVYTEFIKESESKHQILEEKIVNASKRLDIVRVDNEAVKKEYEVVKIELDKSEKERRAAEKAIDKVTKIAPVIEQSRGPRDPDAEPMPAKVSLARQLMAGKLSTEAASNSTNNAVRQSINGNTKSGRSKVKIRQTSKKLNMLRQSHQQALANNPSINPTNDPISRKGSTRNQSQIPQKSNNSMIVNGPSQSIIVDDDHQPADNSLFIEQNEAGENIHSILQAEDNNNNTLTDQTAVNEITDNYDQ